MLESLAGMVMATKIHFAQMQIPFIKKRDRVVAEEIYKNKVNKLEETEKLVKYGLLPFSYNEFLSLKKEWKENNPNLDGNVRDYADIIHLVILSNLEVLNASKTNNREFNLYRKIANKLDLLESCGSDFHGKQNTSVGIENEISKKLIYKIKER
jgi:hypothetical protein